MRKGFVMIAIQQRSKPCRPVREHDGGASAGLLFQWCAARPVAPRFNWENLEGVEPVTGAGVTPPGGGHALRVWVRRWRLICRTWLEQS
jgi:hypothetical protein